MLVDYPQIFQTTTLTRLDQIVKLRTSESTDSLDNEGNLIKELLWANLPYQHLVNQGYPLKMIIIQVVAAITIRLKNK